MNNNSIISMGLNTHKNADETACYEYESLSKAIYPL
ncbi:MAG: hypothetical protein ACJAXN_000616 [Psychromonas sp.]|jgi:hypothetical protein